METIIQAFEQHAKNFPDKIAFSFHTSQGNLETITFKELEQRAKKIAMQLKKITQEQDKIILIFHPGINLIVFIVACFYSHCIAILTYPPFNARELLKFKHIVEDIKAQYIIAEPNIAKKINILKTCSLLSKIPFATLFSSKLRKIPQIHFSKTKILNSEILLIKNKEIALNPVKSDNIAFVQYTSGTTLAPKGVVVAHENLVHNLNLIKHCYQLTPKDTVIFWLPPYHDMGLVGGIFSCLFNGFTCRLFSPFTFLEKPELWFQLITQYQGTVICAPNFAYEYCVNKLKNKDLSNYNLSSLRFCLSGSEMVNPFTFEKFSQTFSSIGFDKKCFSPCYGLAEVTLFAAGKIKSTPFNILELKNNKIFTPDRDQQGNIIFKENHKYLISVGKPYLDIKIINSEGELCEETEIGEIYLAGKSLAKGYYQNEELTQKTFNNKMINSSEYYLKTGDLGFSYQSELYICGRIKEMIIIRGINYYPTDIEYSVIKVQPQLKKHIVVAYSDIDSNHQEKLIIVEEIPATLSSQDYYLLAENINQQIMLEHSIKVDQIYFVKEKSIPKTTSGKIQRQMVKELIHENKITILFHYIDQIASEKNQKPIEVDKHAIELNLAKKKNKESSKIEFSTESLIKKILSQLLNKPESNFSDFHKNLSELGLDSLLIVEFYHGIQEHFSELTFTLSDLLKCQTLADVQELIIHEYNNGGENKKLSSSAKLAIEKDTKTDLAKNSFSTTVQMDLFTKCLGNDGFFAEERRSQDQYYAEPLLEGACDAHMSFQGKKMLIWSINDYLGLANDERIKKSAIDAIEKFSPAYPMGSRLLTGHTEHHQRLEKQLAQFVNKEAALLGNYGYQAIIGIIDCLVAPDDIVIVDHNAHSCIVDGAKLAVSKKENLRVFKHNDMSHLEDILKKIRRFHQHGILIVTDGVYGMSGELVPLKQLVLLKEKYQARLLVDDAHGFGVMGKTGRGIGEHYNLQDKIDLYFATFAKSMAGIGCFVAGDQAIIDYIKWNSKAVIFSKNLPLIYVKAVETALNIIQQEPERLEHLWHITSTLQQGLKDLGFNIGKTQSIVTPVYFNIHSLEQGKSYLRILREEHDLFVSAVSYPVIELGKFIFRLVPTAKHSLEDVSKTLHAFHQLKLYISENNHIHEKS